MYNHHSIQKIQQDVSIALEAVMGDSSPEMLDEMSSIFLQDAAPLLQQMKVGFAHRDFNAIVAAAHTLKGSSATIGLEKLADLSQAVELSCKAQEVNKIGPLIASLEVEYTHIEKALRHFLL